MLPEIKNSLKSALATAKNEKKSARATADFCCFG
jgi:hypothetical protein